MVRTALLVGNPTAQSGKARAGIDRALAGLASRGVRAMPLPTEPAGRTVGLVQAAITRERPDLVVAFGGDGTFNEVARGILAEAGADGPAPPVRSPTTMGMLAMGTANDQARSFGMRPGWGATVSRRWASTARRRGPSGRSSRAWPGRGRTG
jgi:diacylglycerol kinase family enzyme